MNFAALLLAMSMACIDAFALPFIKGIHSRKFSIYWLIVPVILYAMQPLIFYKSMNYAQVTNMNLMWDLSSDILVTLVGIGLLKERFNKGNTMGIILGFIALGFFTLSG